MSRDILFTASTPYPGATTVVCYRETWEQKLTSAGRIGDQTRLSVGVTLEAPAAVVTGTTNPGYIAFISDTIISPNSRAPFVVFVDPDGMPHPAVASLGFRKDFTNYLATHDVLWLRMRVLRGDDK